MSYNNGIQVVPVEQEDQERINFNFGSFLNRCLKGWYWIVLSLAFCLGIAAFRVLSTNPRYTRSASVLIKEGATRRLATNDLESMLSLSSAGGMTSKVVNEAIAFDSPALMQEVVNRLGLTTSYCLDGTFRDEVIYSTQVPVDVEFENLEGGSLTFRINKIDSTRVSLSKIVYRYQKDKFKFSPITAVLGEKTDIGGVCKVTISLSEYYRKDWKKAVIVSKSSLASTTSSYSQRLKVEAMDVKNRSDVLSLSFSDYSVQRADDVINTLINIYNEKWVEDRNKMAIATSQFIDRRLSSLEGELRNVDDNISNFKSRNLLPDLNMASTIFSSQTVENARQIQEVEYALNNIRFTQQYLNDNPGIEALVPIMQGNTSLAAEIGEYNERILKRNSLRSNASEQNPYVIDLNVVLTGMRKTIDISVQTIINSLERQLADLRGIESKTNDKMAENPSQQKYLLNVGRQQKVKETLYVYLLQKKEENELSQAFTAYNTRVLTPPMGIARPTSPNPARSILIALIIGLLAPVVVFYFLEITDTKIRLKKDLESLTLPFIGEIPQFTNGKKDDRNTSMKILVKQGKRDVLNEAMRIVRTNIEFLERGHKCPVIINCSFNPGSGKTFISANISAALSIKGNKVLTIDGDLRKATLSEYIGSPKKGITEYLSGSIDNVEDIIRPVPEIDNLFILPVGTIPPNPAELISLPRFSELLEKMRKLYDYIIIDCPPIDIVADTQIIAEYADRTIFVVRSGVLEKKDVGTLESFYENKRFNNLCYVFNGVENTMSYYGHYGLNYYQNPKKKSTSRL